MTRKIAVAIAVVTLNFFGYGFAFLYASRQLYATRRPDLLICVCFLGLGAVSRLWSATWWSAMVPAVGGYFWGLGALKWAIQFTDARGEYAPPMTHFMFSPSLSEALWALAAGTAAGIGGWAARLVKTGRVARSSRRSLLDAKDLKGGEDLK